jgi:hypothetical protein
MNTRVHPANWFLHKSPGDPVDACNGVKFTYCKWSAGYLNAGKHPQPFGEMR